ncbi:hypothetical protein [Corynebacterium glutamicum]|nr:hypothetical protein [Corynebacterium glutamicum]
MQVAIVNSPSTDTVEMFVNDAPILRDTIGQKASLPLAKRD